MFLPNDAAADALIALAGDLRGKQATLFTWDRELGRADCRPWPPNSPKPTPSAPFKLLCEPAAFGENERHGRGSAAPSSQGDAHAMTQTFAVAADMVFDGVIPRAPIVR